MIEELAPYQTSNTAIEAVIAKGDLSKLTPQERVNYYVATCRSLGLNELTQPFGYITLSGKLTLYAKRDAADQLRKKNGVSLGQPGIQFQDDLVIVSIDATDTTGRTDSDLGAVFIGTLKGVDRANAIMKAITKAKRRVTLSICGLGWADETEIETIPDARPVVVDTVTGEIVDGNGNGKAEPTTWPARPWEPTVLRDYMLRKVKAYTGKVKDADGHVKACMASLHKIALEDADRHTITLYLFGVESSKDLTEAQRSALLDWIGANETNEYQPSPTSVDEAKRVVRAYQEEHGQMTMLDDLVNEGEAVK